MGKRLSFLLVVLALLLSGQPLESQEFPFDGSEAYQALLRAAYNRLERFAALLDPSKILFRADGGGDGGGGDGAGGSGDGGGGSGDGTGGGSTGGDSTGGDSTGGDSTGADSTSAAAAAAATSDAAATDAAATDAAATDAAATDAAATDAAATDAAATDAATAAAAATDAATTAATDAAATDAAATDAAAPDPAAPDPAAPDPAAVDNAVTTDPTAPVTVTVNAPTVAPTNQTTVTPELAAIESIPTTDPRGGEVLAPPVNNGAPGGAVPALGGPGAAPVDVAINAVIVSAAQSPWDAIRRARGVRNVIITGGIVALGKTPIPGEIPGGGPQPAWLRVIPDLRLLNGLAIPPVVPNVIDIRIMNCPIKIEND
jgi:hypothetical protein